MSAAQIALRNELCDRVLREMQSGRINAVHATIALMGVAAVIAGTLSPDDREALVAGLDGEFARMVEMRAKEIRSGEWDAEVAAQ
jgi:hypothetical protein